MQHNQQLALEQGWQLEPAPCYFAARGLVGVPTLAEYLRTIAGIGLWIFGPPFAARFMARHNRRAALHVIERWWARRLRQHLAIRLEISGAEHIAADTTYIVTPLHEGFADIIALLHLPLDMRFAARDELFDWLVLGSYLRETGHISVSPERGSRSYRHLLRAAGELDRQGESLVVFPQGTILGIETDFHSGAFALARALQRPILPIALTGSHRVWEHPYSPRLRYHQRVSLRVLPPVRVDRTTDVEQLRQQVQRDLKAAALDGHMATPRHFVPQRDGYWDAFAYRIDPDFPELAADVAEHRALVAAHIISTH